MVMETTSATQISLLPLRITNKQTFVISQAHFGIQHITAPLPCANVSARDLATLSLEVMISLSGRLWFLIRFLNPRYLLLGLRLWEHAAHQHA